MKGKGKGLLLYLGLAFLFYFAAKEAITYRLYEKPAPVQTTEIGEIVEGDVIEQVLEYDGDFLFSLSFSAATYARNNQGMLQIAVSTMPWDSFTGEREIGSAEECVVQTYDMEQIADNAKLTMPIGKRWESSLLYLRITATGAFYGNAITFYAAEASSLERVLFRNGQPEAYALCVGIEGGRRTFLGRWYGAIVAVVGCGVGICLLWMFGNGEPDRIGNRLLSLGKQYGFLVHQLVKRDFKTKYKRSMLGFCWSFFNPLLTMLVQYIVFSTLFRSDIENFPLYLLSGGILFNFFTESVGGGLGAIVGNAALITKVYVPKYIYPCSKVLSTAINLVISMLPLLVAVWLTGEKVTRAFLLLPFLFLCLLLFCVGMSLLLATSMVFFRDTQFLWGIVSLIWMYATPIFYPESILPERVAFLLRWNPMVHYLKFFREILLQGRSPQMAEYGYCIGFAIGACLVGAIVFRKAQHQFVLYL